MPLKIIITFLLLTLTLVRVTNAQTDRETIRAEVQKAYGEYEQAYLQSDWETLKKMRKNVELRQGLLQQDQRANLKYIRDTAGKFKPNWWPMSTSAEPVEFPAEIWGKRFTASYRPWTDPGPNTFHAPNGAIAMRKVAPGTRVEELKIVSEWRPQLIDNLNPATGKLAEIHGITLGDIGEVLAWHALGYNYIALTLSRQDAVTLYTDHYLLYGHLQEFYADMTALYYASPRSKRVQLFIRLQDLDFYLDKIWNSRVPHGIGAILLADMLANPDAWPSVHFPPAVAKQQVELNAIIYVYEHWEPNWNVTELRRFSQLIQDFMQKQGDRMLRHKGEFDLPNRLKFNLMVEKDGLMQERRDAWVAMKLEKLIESRRADPMPEDGYVVEKRWPDSPENGSNRLQPENDKLRLDITL